MRGREVHTLKRGVWVERRHGDGEREDCPCFVVHFLSTQQCRSTVRILSSAQAASDKHLSASGFRHFCVVSVLSEAAAADKA